MEELCHSLRLLQVKAGPRERYANSTQRTPLQSVQSPNAHAHTSHYSAKKYDVETLLEAHSAFTLPLPVICRATIRDCPPLKPVLWTCHAKRRMRTPITRLCHGNAFVESVCCEEYGQRNEGTRSRLLTRGTEVGVKSLHRMPSITCRQSANFDRRYGEFQGGFNWTAAKAARREESEMGFCKKA